MSVKIAHSNSILYVKHNHSLYNIEREFLSYINTTIKNIYVHTHKRI